MVWASALSNVILVCMPFEGIILLLHFSRRIFTSRKFQGTAKK
uniref:Uncharacterized protein n=1 Tax=Rhizophora mucronata TaxID=61149 RepID=A0A2P2QT94_RHIMU